MNKEEIKNKFLTGLFAAKQAVEKVSEKSKAFVSKTGENVKVLADSAGEGIKSGLGTAQAKAAETAVKVMIAKEAVAVKAGEAKQKTKEAVIATTNVAGAKVLGAASTAVGYVAPLFRKNQIQVREKDSSGLPPIPKPSSDEKDDSEEPHPWRKLMIKREKMKRGKAPVVVRYLAAMYLVGIVVMGYVWAKVGEGEEE